MTTTTTYHTTTLPCGLRVIALPSASPVVYCGFVLGAGTRHEQPGQEGLAHFCEHLTFKGTHRRSAVQIINAIEGLGGELNAFTTKEDTVFYCAVTGDHLRQAVDVLCDMVFGGTYPQREIEKECAVVCDEIESYEDSPAELIFDEFENFLFSGHPLGHNILGSAERVRSYTHSDAQRFTATHYQPQQAVFFCSGQADFGRLTALLQRHLQPLLAERVGDAAPQTPAAMPPAPPACHERTVHRGTHQAHVVMGRRAFAADDERRWALYLLNNMLGGPGLNSRLNLALRERRGLVYTVDSTMVCYADTGLWAVYFGCDPADVPRCRRLVAGELQRLADRPLSAQALRRAQQQLRGQLAIAADNREQFAIDFAKHFLHQGTLHDVAHVIARVEALTAQQLQEVARELFRPAELFTLIYD